MDKLIKFFPFLPEKGDTGKLVLALLIYIGVNIASGIVGFVLGFTIILFPIGVILGFVCFAYFVMGIVFSIMEFTGHSVINGTAKAPADEETVTASADIPETEE